MSSLLLCLLTSPPEFPLGKMLFFLLFCFKLNVRYNNSTMKLWFFCPFYQLQPPSFPTFPFALYTITYMWNASHLHLQEKEDVWWQYQASLITRSSDIDTFSCPLAPQTDAQRTLWHLYEERQALNKLQCKPIQVNIRLLQQLLHPTWHKDRQSSREGVGLGRVAGPTFNINYVLIFLILK